MAQAGHLENNPPIEIRSDAHNSEQLKYEKKGTNHHDK
jgi:hypothetical protein